MIDTDEIDPYVLYFFLPFGLFLFYIFLALLVVKCIFGTTRYYRGNTRLFGKTVIITGGNTGIGKETAIELAKRGARIIIGCRNDQRAEAAVQDIRSKTGNYNVEYRHLDLSDLDSVRKFAEVINNTEPRLDILINNAGIGDQAYAVSGRVTKQNYDLVFGTNHLGHFLLTELLLNLLKISAPSRIINVSSFMHRVHFHPLKFDSTPNGYGKKFPFLSGYRISKLANVMHARELGKMLEGSGVTAYSSHPGLIDTEIWEPFEARMSKPIFKLLKCLLRILALSARGGAQTSIYLAVDETVQGNGKYFSKSKVTTMNKLALDDNACEKLYQVSLEMCDLKPLSPQPKSSQY